MTLVPSHLPPLSGNEEKLNMKLGLAFLISMVTFTSALAQSLGDKPGKKSYKDSDWNVPMWTWNDYLHGQDIEWVDYKGDKALQFTLEGGKPGIAYDTKKKDYGPMFAERNELHTKRYNSDPRIIEFKFKMIKGWRGHHESFFQVHSHNKACKQQEAKPPFMLHLHKGTLRAQTFDEHRKVPKGRTFTVVKNDAGPVTRKQLLGSWHDVKITSKYLDKNRISYSVKSESLGINQAFPNSYMLSCGIPYVKLGIYRPSKASWKHPQSLKKINKTSVIQFDDLKIYSNK